MSKSKHRLGKGKKSKRSSQKGANAKLAPKKTEKTKPHNKAVMTLLSSAAFIKSKVLKIFAAFKTVAKAAKKIWRKAAVPVKTVAIAVKTKCIKTASAIKAAAAAANDKRFKTVMAIKAVSASVKTKWLPIVGVAFWNCIIAPVLAVVIVMRSKPRYMAALLLIAIPAVVITMIAVSFSNAESGGVVPVILAADHTDNSEVSDTSKPVEVNAAIQGEPLESETRLNAATIACVAVTLMLTALVLWAVIPRKSDPSVPLEDIRNEDESN